MSLKRLRGCSGEKPEYCTCFALTGEENMDRLVEVLRDIAQRDPEFRWRFYRMDTGQLVLVVFSRNRNAAYRRGVWLRSRVKELEGKLFWVK